MEEARTVINRFLSLMTWCDDQYAIAQDGWSGNPVPVAVPKRNLAFTTTYHWVFNRDIPVSEDVLRALALYREGRNAEQNFMISRSEEHTSELQSLMRLSYAVFCLKKTKNHCTYILQDYTPNYNREQHRDDNIHKNK